MEASKKLECGLIADRIRRKTLEMIRTANSGHIGGSFSLADMLSVLYFDTLRVDPANPQKPDRDRFILSKGHCCPALYVALAMRGFFPEEDLAGYRSIDSYLSGHAEMRHIPGVDMSTGSLGQGLSVGIGMALNARLSRLDYRTYVVMGDGEIDEGQVWEAAMAAGKYRLDNLVAIIDKNGLQLDGATKDIMDHGDLKGKFEAFGWEVIEIDGHDFDQIATAFERAQQVKGKPFMIIAHTVKGKGVSVFENEIRFHGGRPTAQEYEIAFAELNARINEKEMCICRK